MAQDQKTTTEELRERRRSRRPTNEELIEAHRQELDRLPAPQPALDAGEPRHWKREAPTEAGWHWFKHDPFLYPDLPAPVAAPKLLMLYSDEQVMRAQDTVNMESHFASEMLGYWNGPLVAPEFDGEPAAAVQGKEQG